MAHAEEPSLNSIELRTEEDLGAPGSKRAPGGNSLARSQTRTGCRQFSQQGPSQRHRGIRTRRRRDPDRRRRGHLTASPLARTPSRTRRTHRASGTDEGRRGRPGPHHRHRVRRHPWTRLRRRAHSSVGPSTTHGPTAATTAEETRSLLTLAALSEHGPPYRPAYAPGARRCAERAGTRGSRRVR